MTSYETPRATPAKRSQGRSTSCASCTSTPSVRLPFAAWLGPSVASKASERKTHVRPLRTSRHRCDSLFFLFLSPGQDFLCVQGVDGSLTFFEQENFAFARYLPEFLLPGPLAYISKTDSFVTVNTAFHLENFRFQTLAVATEASKKPSDDTNGLQKGKRVVADWSVSIGEEALDIKVASFPNCPTLILVLGEHTFFAFKPSGELHFLKMLDFTAACFFPYPSFFPGRKKTETDLKVKVFAGPMSEVPCSDENVALTEDGNAFIPALIVKVHLESPTPLHDVRIMVDVAKPLVALNGDVTLTSLLDHHQMAFTVKQAGPMLPSSLDLKVVALYQSSSGVSSCIRWRKIRTVLSVYLSIKYRAMDS
ncbi:hypothetical protein V5799_024305 [Amblyomma americanum]|uniref:PTHB1 N-terminal domain-containing protein n=1 Tax=Amblyomma americanum TaxID=6943 RepID=A0AAQ4ECH3_AMBAM